VQPHGGLEDVFLVDGDDERFGPQLAGAKRNRSADEPSPTIPILSKMAGAPGSARPTCPIGRNSGT